MKIQIISLGMTDQSHRKFYNTQDMGLGRALAAMGHNVDMYSFIKGDTDEVVEFSDNLRMNYLHSPNFGFHSLHSLDFVTEDIDAIICFADNQMNFGRLIKRCREKKVVCLPYIGTLGSHNASTFKKRLLDLFASNIKYYRHMTTLAKTPDVKRQMEECGITDIVVAPCCLDLEAVHKFEHDCDIELGTADAGKTRDGLRSEISLSEDNKVILYLARLIDEKHPLEMLDIFDALHREDPSYRMISIGRGELQEQFEQKIAELGLKEAVCRIESIPNSEVWKYYCMADVMVNLNRVEIFGMAILEAMYYGCPVVARRAPGPEYILDDDENGYLCDDSAEVIARVKLLCKDAETRERITVGAKERIMKDFVWQSTAQIMLDVITKKRAETDAAMKLGH